MSFSSLSGATGKKKDKASSLLKMASPKPTKNQPITLQLNVGGVNFTTTKRTLCMEQNSLLADFFQDADYKTKCDINGVIIPLENSTFLIDRDGLLFRYVLNYLQSGKIILPDQFNEVSRLREEAKFYRLPGLQNQLQDGSVAINRTVSTSGVGVEGLEGGGYVTIGYRGTFAFGRDGQADVKFRKLNRLLVAGKSALCREVFGDFLNESRDPDRGGENRYTSRLYLKHNSLEHAFDMLAEKRFKLLSSCASGTCCPLPHQTGPTQPPAQEFNMPRVSTESEEQRWNHYNEFIFFRDFSAPASKLKNGHIAHPGQY